jgi:hypothetical protein
MPNRGNASAQEMQRRRADEILKRVRVEIGDIDFDEYDDFEHYSTS